MAFPPPPKPNSAPASHGSPSEEHDDMVLDEPPPKHDSASTSHGSPSLEREEEGKEGEEEEEVWVIDPPPRKPACAGGGAGARHWSAEVEKMKSLLDSQKLLNMCRKFGISEEKYRAFCPEDGWGPCKTPPPGSVCVYKDMLEVGVRFPLHHFYTKILRHYRIAPSQLTPNAWRYLAGFVLVCDGAGVKPTLPVFRYYFKLTPTYGSKSKLQGWYCFTPYSTCRRLFDVDNGARSYDGWKKFYFFLESRSAEMAWRCPTKWGTPSEDSLKRPVVLDDAATEARKKLDRHRGKQSLQSVLSTCDKLPVLLPTLELPPVKEEAGNDAFVRSTSPPRKYRAMSSLMDSPPQQLAVAMASSSSPPPASVTPEPDPEITVCAVSCDRQQRSASQMMAGALEAMERTEKDLQRVKDELQKEKSKHASDVDQLNKELGAAKAEHKAQVAKIFAQLNKEFGAAKAKHTVQVAKLSAEKAESEATVRQLMEELNAEKIKANQIAENFRLAEAKHAAEVKALNDIWQLKVTDAQRQVLRETGSGLMKTIEYMLTKYSVTKPAIQTPPGFPPHQALQAPVTRVDFHRTIKEEVEAREGTEGTSQTMQDLMMTRCPSINPAILTPEAAPTGFPPHQAPKHQ